MQFLLISGDYVRCSSDRIAGTETSPGKRWAICVGIDDYEDSAIHDLGKAENDAAAIAESLSFYGQFDQVVLMSGSDNPRQ